VGPEDQIGMLNLITSEAVVESAKLVREGRVSNLSVALLRARRRGGQRR